MNPGAMCKNCCIKNSRMTRPGRPTSRMPSIFLFPEKLIEFVGGNFKEPGGNGDSLPLKCANLYPGLQECFGRDIASYGIVSSDPVDISENPGVVQLV